MTFNLDVFESDAHQNGMRYWIAHDFMERLSYKNWASFSQVINKAMSSCVELGVKINESFIETTIEIDGKSVDTYKLTRFACFLITMHADSKKEAVSKAKLVLAALADAALEISDVDIQRLETRAELKVGEGIMSSIAMSEAGLKGKEMGVFKDAGYRGMYNMSLADLKEHKKMPGPSTGILYDFMGVTELAANSFRATQTAERLKSHNAKGLKQAKDIARDVGRDVRRIMLDNSGLKPEDLALEDNLNDVKKELKKTNRDMKRIDKV